jgi:hypothetical protein
LLTLLFWIGRIGTRKTTGLFVCLFVCLFEPTQMPKITRLLEQRRGGFTFDPTLFPFPADTLSQLKVIFLDKAHGNLTRYFRRRARACTWQPTFTTTTALGSLQKKLGSF